MISGKNSPWLIRTATLADLDKVKCIADSRRQELGFVLRPSLAESIERRELLVAEEKNQIVGFVDYHLRRDKQVTLYHIATEVARQQEGIGRALVDALVTATQKMDCTKISLKCPTELPANHFYQLYGFKLDDTLNGRKRPLNVWTFPLE